MLHDRLRLADLSSVCPHFMRSDSRDFGARIRINLIPHIDINHELKICTTVISGKQNLFTVEPQPLIGALIHCLSKRAMKT